MNRDVDDPKNGDGPPPLFYDGPENRETSPVSRYAKGESRTCKVVDTPHVAAAVYWFSCLLPEATHFKVSEMPVIQKERGVMRLLVIAGNLTHFAGDMDTILIEHWKKSWDHILYVPGPYEYGKGTLCAGDDYCIALQHQMGMEKFTLFNPGLTDTVFFPGPGLRVLGVPCWPTDSDIYREACVYGSTRGGEGGAGLSGSALLQARVKLMDKKRYAGKSEMERRLKQDVAVLITALREVEDKRDQETRMVVTYGCPDEQLATTVKHNDPFRGVARLGSAAVYKYLSHHVDWWIHGAKGDQHRSSMCNGHIITLCNVHTAINHLSGDGFRVHFADAIRIERRKGKEDV